MNKKMIKIKLMFIIAIASILTTLLVGMAFAAELSAVTDNIRLDSLVGLSLPTFAVDRNEKTYSFPCRFIAYDGEGWVTGSYATISGILAQINQNAFSVLNNCPAIYCLRHHAALPGAVGGGTLASQSNIYYSSHPIEPYVSVTYDYTTPDPVETPTLSRTIFGYQHLDFDDIDGVENGIDDIVPSSIEPYDESQAEATVKGQYPTQTIITNVEFFVVGKTDSNSYDDLIQDLTNSQIDSGYEIVGPTHVISYALTFSQKESYLGNSTYGQERCQNTIWLEFGEVWTEDASESRSAGLHDAGVAVDLFDAEHASHYKGDITVSKRNGAPSSVLSGSNIGHYNSEPTGTTITLSNGQLVYRVGPFEMSDYAYLANDDVVKYSGKDLSVDKDLVGGLVYGEVVLNNGKVIPIGYNERNGTNAYKRVEGAGNSVPTNHAKIVYVDSLGNATYQGENNRAQGKSGFKNPSNYQYPWPKSVFYIEIPYSEAKGATDLTGINFDYRTTTTSGHGWVISGKYVQSNWRVQNEAPCDETYYADCGGMYWEGTHTGSDYFDEITMTRTIGGVHEGTDHYHSFVDYCSALCDDVDEDEDEWPCDCIDDLKGACIEEDEDGGKYCGGVASGALEHDCSGHNYTYECYHTFTNCHHFDWVNQDITVNQSQPLLAVHDANVYVNINEYDNDIDVRLTTDVTIDKFITRVDHVGEDINVYNNATERKGLTDTVKEGDPVKAERGDRVTYNIVLMNKQDVPVQVQIKDILPEYCILESVKVGGTELTKYYFTFTNDGNLEEKFFITSWITVPAGTATSPGTVTVEEKIIATAADSSFTNENRASLVSSNAGRTATTVTKDIESTNYVRMVGNLPASAVVNVAEIIEPTTYHTELHSSDFYKIKEYYVAVDKYIYDVTHNPGYTLPNTIDTTIAAGDSRNVKTISGADKAAKENTKDKNPVYAEFGDTITYKIQLYNTKNDYPFFNDRDNKPYWNPDKVYVDVKDTLPNKYTDLTIEIDNQVDSNVTNSVTINGSGSYTGNAGKVDLGSIGGTLNLENVMIPKDGITTITITLVVDEFEKGTKEINEAEHIFYNTKYLRNINYTVNHNQVENRSAGQDNSNSTDDKKSKDVYIINNYNVFIDKYVYAYDEKIHDENNNGLGGNSQLKVTNEQTVTTGVADVTGNGKVLSINRVNTNDTKGSNTDNPSYNRTIMAEPYRLAGDVDTDRRNYPVSVEQNEKIVYAIKVTNEAETITNSSVATGTKNATQVRPDKITDMIEHGLTYQSVIAKVYSADGTVRMTPSVTNTTVNASYVRHDDVESVDRTYEVHEFTVPNDVLLDPGEYIIYYVTVRIDETNMYLFNLDNTAQLKRMTNINKSPEKDRYIFEKPYDGDPTRNENICEAIESHEFVRMKDLVISGRVWLDINRDGYINEGTLPTNYDKYYGLDSNALKKDVVVKLYKVTNGNAEMIRTTKTDEHGLYTFAKDRSKTFLTTGYNHTKYIYNATTNNNNGYQRVDKANNKDAYGNYVRSSSDYIDYYIEFEYDGVIYKSTEVYSNQSNLDSSTGAIKDDMIASIGGAEVRKYEVDSNAYEFKDIREAFNTKYEYISYNIAYDLQMKTATYGDMIDVNKLPEGDAFGIGTSKSTGLLEFDKTGHDSFIRENSERIMTSRSFVKDVGLNQSINNTSLLWLFKYTKTNNNGVDGVKIPKSEYTKFINLGLELREDVDLSLTKDVYKIKTTINGEEMEYTYNVNDGINGRMTDTNYTTVTNNNKDYLQDYIIKQPYGLEIYDADYMFRFDQYQEEAVRNYKEDKSELNVEVTYRMSIDNNRVSDDETIDGATETPLDVRVEELIDIYDQNFMRYYDGVAPVVVKHKDANGYLVDYNIDIAEAWYFKKISDMNAEQFKLLSATSGTNITGASSIPSDMRYALFYSSSGSAKKGVYTQSSTGDYVKIPLKVSDKSIKNNMQTNGNYDLAGGLTPVDASKGLAFSEREKYVSSFVDAMNQDGYNKYYATRGTDTSKRNEFNLLYITGMGDEVIHEGESLDVYIKYVLNKDDMTIENENIRLDEISDITSSSSLQVIDNGTSIYGKLSFIIADSDSTTFILRRSLQIVEEALTQMDKRGLEGIAQINAYSVWYTDGKPASLVDKDSNAGNIGVSEDARDSGALTGKMLNDSDRYLDTVGHVDDISIYEDTTYRTGIELYAKGVKEPTPPEPRYKEYELNGDPVRQIKGVVYDDARSVVLGEENSTESLYGAGSTEQYMGNGLFMPGDSKIAEAKMNECVTINYKDESVTEQNDITVRNAKVEFIEITKMPDTSNQARYYESVRKNVTSTLIQNIRTDENGNYELLGLMPGEYIVRYTYGDTVNEEECNYVHFNKDSYVSDVREAKTNEATRLALVDEATRDMQVFNGQDYKATQYNSIPDSITNNDEIIKELEKPEYSDARDDEIRRLSTIAFSEIMTNEKAEILKGLANGTRLTEATVDSGLSSRTVQKGQENTPEQLKTLTDNTYMQAETVEFLIKTEKLTEEQMAAILASGTEKFYDDNHNEITDPDYIYQYYRTMFRHLIESRNFKLENLDFGIEYRPEAEISLIKEVNEVKVITQDDEVLIDLHFLTDFPTYGQKVVHKIDYTNSIGTDTLKFFTNRYSDNYILDKLLVAEEELQGLVYNEIDLELLQGATIEITYKFEAENDSEVDRISKRLNALRYYNNAASQELKNRYQSLWSTNEDIRNLAIENMSNFRRYRYTQPGNYTGSRTAMNDVYERFYRLDENNDEYRNSKKTFNEDLENSYYGSYTGIAYVKGNSYEDANHTNSYKVPFSKIRETDIISTIKFNAILDYIDTNLTYNTVLSSSTDTLNRLWKPVTATQLQYHSLAARRAMIKAFGEGYDRTYTGFLIGDVDDDLLSRSNVYLTNVSGERYDDLVVSVDDRLSDLDDDLRGFNSDGSKIEESPANDSLSRFLYPDVTIQKNPEVNGTEKYTPEGWTHRYANGTASTGIIYLPTQKVQSSEISEDELQFENLAEIIEFTTLTGRRTNFAITIGNVDLLEVEKYRPTGTEKWDGVGSIEFVTARLEPDQASTEIVSFVPITGLRAENIRIINTIEAAKTGINYMVIIGAIVAIVVLITRFGIMKYRKRRIK